MWTIFSVFATLFVGAAAYFTFENQAVYDKEVQLLEMAQKHEDLLDDFIESGKKEQKSRAERLIEENKLLEDANEKLETVKTEQANLQREKNSLTTSIEQKNAELNEIKAKIAELGPIRDLLPMVETLTSDISDLTTNVATNKQETASVTKQIATAKQNIEEMKNTEEWQRSGKMKAVNAQVSFVDNAYGYCIISAGNNQKAATGAKFEVLRGNEQVGVIEISILHLSSSICKILEGNVRVGDRLRVHPDSVPSIDESSANDLAQADNVPILNPNDLAPAPADALDLEPKMDDDPFSGLRGAGQENSDSTDDIFGLGN